MWFLTVFSLITNRRAISRFVAPCANADTTSISRLVSAGGAESPPVAIAGACANSLRMRPATAGRLDPANAEILYKAVNAVGLVNTTIQVVD